VHILHSDGSIDWVLENTPALAAAALSFCGGSGSGSGVSTAQPLGLGDSCSISMLCISTKPDGRRSAKVTLTTSATTAAGTGRAEKTLTLPLPPVPIHTALDASTSATCTVRYDTCPIPDPAFCPSLCENGYGNVAASVPGGGGAKDTTQTTTTTTSLGGEEEGGVKTSVAAVNKRARELSRALARHGAALQEARGETGELAGGLWGGVEVGGKQLIWGNGGGLPPFPPYSIAGAGTGPQHARTVLVHFPSALGLPDELALTAPLPVRAAFSRGGETLTVHGEGTHMCFDPDPSGGENLESVLERPGVSGVGGGVKPQLPTHTATAATTTTTTTSSRWVIATRGFPTIDLDPRVDAAGEFSLHSRDSSLCCPLPPLSLLLLLLNAHYPHTLARTHTHTLARTARAEHSSRLLPFPL